MYAYYHIKSFPSDKSNALIKELPHTNQQRIHRMTLVKKIMILIMIMMKIHRYRIIIKVIKDFNPMKIVYSQMKLSLSHMVKLLL